MNNRTYMTIINDFYNYCSLKQIDIDTINEDIINKYISLHKENPEIIEALNKYYSYYNKKKI